LDLLMISATGWSERLGCASDTEEARAGPMRAGDRPGDLRERAIALRAILEARIQNQYAMGLAAPLAHQFGTTPQRSAWCQRPFAFGVERLRQRLELPQGRLAQTTQGTLLQLVGEGADQEIAAEPLGRKRAVEPPPLAAQLRRIQAGEGVELRRQA